MNFTEEDKTVDAQSCPAACQEPIELPAASADAHVPDQVEQEAPAVQPTVTQPVQEVDQPRVDPVQIPAYTQQRYTYTSPVAPKKKSGGFWSRFLAVCIIVVVIFGCCGATAYVLSAQWQRELAQINQTNNQQLTALKKQIAALEKELTSVGGGTVVIPGGTSTGEVTGLTPAQVYALRAKSVVAVSSEISTGSGFIISGDGYIVTNYHVVEGGASLWITTNLQMEYDAQLIGYNAVNDIALLKIDATDLPYAPIGSSDQLSVGDQVVAIGNPLGELTSTLTVGYVSAKDRIVNTDGNSMSMLQTDAAINSGNSGGPLFNMNGQVVGITTAKYSGYSNSGATIEGIGFAIPIDDVFDMIEDLRDHGYVTGAYLGVSVRDVEASVIQNYGFPSGAYVAEVVKGACADKAGVQVKDIIIDIGGYSVSSVSELTRVLRKFEPGDRTVITVYRNGTEVRLSAVLDEKPQNATQEPSVQQPTQAPTQAPTEPDSGDYEQWWNEIFPPFFGWG